MWNRTLLLAAALAVAAGFATRWLTAAADPLTPDPVAPRTIRPADTVFTEDMTWMEIRDAVAAGKDTLILATGGIEQNGPYLVTGKHNVILRGTTDAIARKLRNALVAPIVRFVPEGDIDPPTQHMKYPGTISLSEATYEKLLEEICACYRKHGFERIILLGDSGGNQDGMRAVADRLSKEWPRGSTHIHFIPEYYDVAGLNAWLEKNGVKQHPEGYHDDFANTAQMMAVDPSSVRMQQRLAAGKFHINGIDLSPPDRTIEWGKRIIDYRANQAVKAIQRAIASETPK